MYALKPTGQFKRDLKKMAQRRKDLCKIKGVIADLQQGKALPPQQRDHGLVGNWRGFRDCHIEPDWLLLYRIDGLNLILARTGTHADIFG